MEQPLNNESDIDSTIDKKLFTEEELYRLKQFFSVLIEIDYRSQVMMKKLVYTLSQINMRRSLER